jgi:hypothetical protein
MRHGARRESDCCDCFFADDHSDVALSVHPELTAAQWDESHWTGAGSTVLRHGMEVFAGE